MNRYSYVQNDPVNSVDLTGLDDWDDDAFAELAADFASIPGGGGRSFGEGGGGFSFTGAPLGASPEELAHEQRVQNAWGGNGYRTNTEVNRALITSSSRLCRSAGDCWDAGGAAWASSGIPGNPLNGLFGISMPIRGGDSENTSARRPVEPPQQTNEYNVAGNLCVGEGIGGCFGIARNSDGTIYQLFGLDFGFGVPISPTLETSQGRVSTGLSLNGTASISFLSGLTVSQPLYPSGGRQYGGFLGAPQAGVTIQLAVPPPRHYIGGPAMPHTIFLVR